MQSHQNSFGIRAVNAKINHQLSGHHRSPTIGKSMPITDLLQSLSPLSVSAIHSRQACDGSDIYQQQSSIYPWKNQSTSFPNYDNDDNEPNEDGNKNFEKDHIAIDDMRLQKPCLICTGSAPIDLVRQPLAINEMCGVLCNEKCRLGLSLTGYRPITLETPAQKALTELVTQQFTPPQANSIKHVSEKLPSTEGKQQGQITPTSSLSSSSSPSTLSTNVDIMRQKFLTDMLNEQNIDTVNSVCYSPNNFTSEATNSHDTSNKMPEESHEKCEIAEAIAKTSEMTSTTQIKLRLAARKLEIALRNENANIVGRCVHQDASSSSVCSSPDCLATQNGSEYEPPRDLVLHIVRMGSFNSAPKILNNDSQDDGLQIPKDLSTSELLQHIKELRGDKQPPLLTRYFLKPLDAHMVSSDITDSLRYLKLTSVPKVYSPQISAPNHIRLFQWNILSQTLGQNNDGFVCCPEQALTWENRKFLIVQEILQTNPDIICLQEVDHFKFLQNILGTQNYDGIFYPKPDSPCLYIEKNNGPDGCAIFYKRDKFELKNFETRILEVWRVQSNQVAIVSNFRVKGTDTEICVCTTHLKARHGSLLSKLRNEQGRDLLRFVKQFAEERPLLLCGDFNAEPTEPIYSTILNYDELNLSSAYADIKEEVEKCNKNGDKPIDECDKISSSIQREPSYTTWKIRAQGEECHTIDYVFYSKDLLKIKNCLEFPQDDEIGKNRTPSFQYPSDHFSLVCDFEILNNEQQTKQEN